MNRAVAVTLASGGGFIGGFMVPALLLSILGYVTRPPSTAPPTSPVNEIALVVYFVGLYALASAVVMPPPPRHRAPGGSARPAARRGSARSSAS